MSRKLKIAGVILVVFVIVVFGVIKWALQPDKVRALVKDQIEQRWKGEVQIGEASVRLLPPSIALSNLNLLSAENSELIKLGELQIVPDIFKIFSGKVVISSVNLIGPQVSLQSAPDGKLLLEHSIVSAPDETTGLDASKTPPPANGDEGFISEISVNSIQVKDLYLLAPVKAKQPLTKIGPIDSSLSLSLTPVIKVHGNVTLASQNIQADEMKLNTGKAEIQLAFNDGKTELTIHQDVNTVDSPQIGSLQAGPLKGKVTVSDKGDITSKDLTLVLPHGGKVTATCSATFAPTTSVKMTLAGESINLPEILAVPLQALNLTNAGKKALTIKSVDGEIVKSGEAPLKINKMNLTMADNATITSQGVIADAANTKLVSTMKGISIYNILESFLAEYQFGSPIEKVQLANAKVTVQSKTITASDIVTQMGKTTFVKGKIVLNTPKNGEMTIDKSSTLSVQVDGDDLFSVLKLKPDSTLTGTLGGNIGLFGPIINPSARGTLKSSQLKYVYTGAPSVPMKNVVASISLSDFKGKVDSLTADFFSGKLSASAESDLSVTPFTYTWKLDTLKLQLSDMFEEIETLKGHVAGALSISLSGKGSGITDENDSYLKKLSLDGSLESIETKVIDSKGLLMPALGDGPVASAVAGKVDELLSGPALKNFDIRTLTSTVHIEDGNLIFNDVNSTGMVGVKSDSVLIDSEDTSLKGTITFTIPKSETQSIPIPVELQGSLLEPKLKINPNSLKDHFAKEKVNEVTNKIENKLNEKLGDGAGKLLKGLFN